MPRLPRIRQPLIAPSFKHFAMNDTVPRPGRRGLKSEARAAHWLESRGLHPEPSADEFAGSQRLPDRFGRMRKNFLDDDVPRMRIYCRSYHGSISFKSVLKLAKRLRQKT